MWLTLNFSSSCLYILSVGNHSDETLYMVLMVYMVLEIKHWTLSSNPSLLLLGGHALLDKV